MSYSTYDEAFGDLLGDDMLFDPRLPQFTPKRPSGKNPKTLLDNNLKEDLYHEELVEYTILIDSKDRNYQVYPDPYHYEVTFAPLPSYRTIVNGREELQEAIAPVINEDFKHVKYIRLVLAMMPLYDKVCCRDVLEKHEKGVPDEIVKLWTVDKENPTIDNLYTTLTIGSASMAEQNSRSTNDILSNSFAAIYVDELINSTHYKGYSCNGVKVFPQDQLGTLDKMKIDFYDPYGVPMSVKHLDKSILSGTRCTCDASANPGGDASAKSESCFKHNIFHPLNPVFQHHLQFKVGVVRPRITKKSFSR